MSTHPPPHGPFESLQIDFIHMPKCEGYEYILVCIDCFSNWPEAWACRKADSASVVKCLIKDVVLRFGIPHSINSDRGTHFTGQVMTVNH